MHLFDLIALFIFLSGLFIFINTFYLKLPSSVGLIILTLLLSLIIILTGKIFPFLNLAGHVKEFNFTEVLNQLVISVILFAGALNMDINRLGQHRIPIIILSLLGTVLSTFIIGTITYLILNGLSIEIRYIYGLMFGAIISSTDPISATNTTKNFKLPKELKLKVEGESLFNGAFSVVLAFILYHIAVVTEDSKIHFFEVLQVVSLEIIGGSVLGLTLGYAGYRLLKYIDNDETHIEVLLTVSLVMVGSLLSEYINVYSKLVALIMGLLIGNLGKSGSKGIERDSVGPYVYKFWRLLEETMAVMLFVLMGLEMLALNWRMDYFAAGFLAVNVVLFGRWLSIYLPVKVLSEMPSIDKNTVPVMTWSAFRGGLPIALILALQDFPSKELLLTMVYVVVVCSILFQGFTLPILMREKFVNTGY